jgi:Flp pilus assembly protein TadG
MNMFKQGAHLLRSLFASKQGSALPIVGLGVLTLMGATGVAVDMGRVEIVQARMTAALDAAGLAAGASANTANVSTTAANYFHINFPTNFMGSTLNSFSAAINADNTLITLDAQVTVPTTFTRVFGTYDVVVRAHSEITRSNKGMELVIVIDNSGSMTETAGGGTTKIAATKTATNTLLNILYGNTNDTVPNLWVGLVPFSQAVNISNTRGSWTRANLFNWGPTSWGGCVDARENNGLDVTDTVPDTNITSTLFPQYHWVCHTGNNAWHGSNPSTTNCGTNNIRYNTPLDANRGPNKYCPTPVTAMVASKATVAAAVNAMQARGNTLVNQGMVWAWRMLSPNWRNRWGGIMNSNNLPLDYYTPLMNKVVILMTDGDNYIDNNGRGAYWYLSDNKLGTTNQATAVSRLDTHTLQVCTSLKNNGVIIYTVGLGTNISSAGQNVLRNCATNPSYYFPSPTTAQLQTVFQQIGDSLANLRISQ